MSDTPKPPEGYETWMDCILSQWLIRPEYGDYARAELVTLRAERDRYRKALESIRRHLEIVGASIAPRSATYQIVCDVLEVQDAK